jgi:IS1 family transposase
LPGGGRTEKTAQRLLGKFSKDVFLFAKGDPDRKDYTMTIERPAKGVRQHLLPLKASSIQKTESMEWRIA